MATSEITESAPAPAESVSARRRSVPLLLFRLGFIVFLGLLSFLWIQSWSQIRHRFLPVGTGAVELTLAGSSAALSIMNDAFPSVEFGEALGPPDTASLLHYEPRWIDGDRFGRVAGSCLGPPEINFLERVDLDRTGSFGILLKEMPTPFGGAYYFHLRLPVWFLMALTIAGCIWLERSIARRRRAASVPS